MFERDSKGFVSLLCFWLLCDVAWLDPFYEPENGLDWVGYWGDLLDVRWLDFFCSISALYGLCITFVWARLRCNDKLTLLSSGITATKVPIRPTEDCWLRSRKDGGGAIRRRPAWSHHQFECHANSSTTWARREAYEAEPYVLLLLPRIR